MLLRLTCLGQQLINVFGYGMEENHEIYHVQRLNSSLGINPDLPNVRCLIK